MSSASSGRAGRSGTRSTTFGGTIAVALTPDGAYWLTTREAQDLYWTRSDGTIQQHVFGRFRPRLFKHQ